MQISRRALAALALVSVPLTSVAVSSPAAEGARPASDQTAAVNTVLDWQLISMRTVYTENATPVPVGTLYVGFTALAVYDAATEASKRGNASARAAVATAAHDVLAEYFPASQTNLDADLTTTLAAVPDGPEQAKGIRIGRRAADAMIASRVDDGRGDPQWSYDLDPIQPGVWAPAAALPGGMLAPWLGYVDPLIVPTHVQVDGPPGLASAEFARDFNEVKENGSATNPDTNEQAIAHFFYFNSNVTYDRALIAYLRDHPMSLALTSRMFAVLHGAQADAIRTAWKLKREVGFWRPVEAIHRAAEDGNDATLADPAWQPFRATPPYSEYTTGHGALTGAFVQTVRMYLDDVPLHLVSGPVPAGFTVPPARDYANLTDLEFDALNARIYAGIHFRDAMEDGYFIAHETARRAEELLD